MFSIVLASTLLLAPATAPAKSVAHGARRPAAHAEVLPFIADDYPKAVALAKARKVPLFIEAWAPW